MFVSRDVIFEEGLPHQTSASVEEQIPVINIQRENPPAETTDPTIPDNTHQNVNFTNQPNIALTPVEPQQSTQVTQPSRSIIQSMEYMECEHAEKGEGQEWMMNNKHPKANIVIDAPDDHKNVITCINETKASHNIPRPYRHTMSTDPDR